jgi:hypothetical protein
MSKISNFQETDGNKNPVYHLSFLIPSFRQQNISSRNGKNFLGNFISIHN